MYGMKVGLLTLCLVVLDARVIDLSHRHGPLTLMSPGQPHYNRSLVSRGEYLPGVFAENGRYESGEHGGTHMDAPVHFVMDGQTLDDVPIENTIGEGVMIDCSREASLNNSYMAPLDKVLEWEKQHGEIPPEAAVIFNFGWSWRFNNSRLYINTESQLLREMVFPSISEAAGRFLLEQRHVKMIASDTLSPDPLSEGGQNARSLPIHQTYLPRGKLIVENLRGTEELPPRGFRFHAAPVRYADASGAQVRAYAITYDMSSGAWCCVAHFLCVILCSVVCSGTFSVCPLV
ncbi:isatin hydrolase-like [Physella acuta]|uniref:isatin hydrolase-like n=1 Tax=Physella acuta TaxID=109671 RepID=UPI0027DE7FAA|nr:isatin hydrolase-like [Physella acuta]